MTKFYSASTKGFYPLDMRADYEAAGAWPADAIEISEELHLALLNGQENGKRIVSNEQGIPVLIDPPLESTSEALARALVDIKRQRASIMSTLDGISGRMYRAGEIEVSEAADAAIVALLDITKLPQLLAASTYDDMKAIVLARYRQIAAASPAIVQSAFIEAVAP